MTRHVFETIDGHTCGNPVRLVRSGYPELAGATMSERRQDFLKHHDWVRKSLMFEPRGHDVMSGSIVYPPISGKADMAVLFIETSGCLPMCGHGLIGTVTFALEEGLVTPRKQGTLIVDTPAGEIKVGYRQAGDKITLVTLTNVPAFLVAENIEIELDELGTLKIDIAYGGNFYAIIDPQDSYHGFTQINASDILRLSPKIRTLVNDAHSTVHPEDPTIKGVSHILWTTNAPEGCDGKNAVFYGDKAIDRSPCGTGTSARMAQLYAKGQLKVGDPFIHESIIGSQFTGRVEKSAKVGPYEGIIPSISGKAHITGYNKIIVDDHEPFPEGFLVL